MVGTSTIPARDARVESHIRLDRTKLLSALNARALSTAEFAIKAKVSAGTLSAVLNHGKPVTPRVARRIAAGLMNIPAVAGLAELMPDEVAA